MSAFDVKRDTVYFYGAYTWQLNDYLEGKYFLRGDERLKVSESTRVRIYKGQNLQVPELSLF